MVKYNAIVVFEDLNSGFKRGRFSIEKQIYQNLELALAKKLNYLTLKENEAQEPGSFRKAFQLTPKISNFKDIYKQCGFMFYIPASYTSAVCPNCGFRKNIPTPIGNKDKNKDLISKFSISYDQNKDRFKFTYKKADFINNNRKKDQKQNNLKSEFVFHSDVERLQFRRHKDNRGGETKQIEPNEELKNIFKKNGVDILQDINKQIKEGDYGNDNFYKRILHNIRLMLQLRNSITKKDKQGNEVREESRDFIQCPSCYFHSEDNPLSLINKYKGEDSLQFNGDANGAYNIARKGCLVLSKISDFSKTEGDLSKMTNQDLTVTQEEWDEFAQSQQK
jgi:CRISPR-associated protein Cpf1